MCSAICANSICGLRELSKTLNRKCLAKLLGYFHPDLDFVVSNMCPLPLFLSSSFSLFAANDILNEEIPREDVGECEEVGKIRAHGSKRERDIQRAGEK